MAKSKQLTNGEETNKGGRPRKIKSPEEFDALVDGYLNICKEANEPVLFIGLVLALGLSCKDSFYEYEKYDGFSESVKRARSLIEIEYEKRLVVGNNAAAPIFALKNFGWKDKQEIDHTHNSGNVTTLAEMYDKFNSQP